MKRFRICLTDIEGESDVPEIPNPKRYEPSRFITITCDDGRTFHLPSECFVEVPQ